MADVTLNLIIPDVWVSRCLDAFTLASGRHLVLKTGDISAGPKDTITWDFELGKKDTGETNTEFGKRVCKELVIALIRMVEYAQDEQRYWDDVDDVVAPAQSVPDDIVQ